MARPRQAEIRYRVDPRDVPPEKAARRLHLTLARFNELLPNLIKRGFPEPDPDTGMFDLDAIDLWRKSRHRSAQSLALAEQNTQPSRPVRRFGEKLNGGRVKFKGLKIANARGKYYVYRRETGEPLIKGFIGSRAELLQKLEDPEFIQVYNRPRLLKRRAGDFPIESLGGFVHWYTCGAIDDAKEGEVDGYPKWWKLAKSTRDDYLDAFDYLRPEFDIVLKDITQPALYEVRDTCANDKWPRFADQMIAALSSMFGQAVKRGKMSFNPCLGMDKAHKADPNANREWEPEEWQFARENAPLEIKICLFLARYAGLRGQTIVQVNRKQFKAHPLTGQGVRYKARKNGKIVNLPVLPELQAFMGELKVQRADGLIAVRDDGTVWPSEKEMQTRVSHWLRDQERASHIGAGTTLHGLRVSYAAWWRRNGANTREVADLIGDESERMGAHYTRHVEAEQNIIRAFSRISDRLDNA